MGYTIYWNNIDRKGNFSEEFVKEVNAIIDGCNVHLTGDESGDNVIPPVITPERIILNGIGDDSHEPLWLDSTFGATIPKQGRVNPEFDFVKTARKPYTVVAAKILLLAEEYGYIEDVDHDENRVYWEKIGVYDNHPSNNSDGTKTENVEQMYDLHIALKSGCGITWEHLSRQEFQDFYDQFCDSNFEKIGNIINCTKTSDFVRHTEIIKTSIEAFDLVVRYNGQQKPY